ncbi:uncharacterized protein [Oryza sativa Japonica Group]|uniref:uncharacterized protein isoform X2 n=1 Tax=Oryza sativa subsp. japonica TaxID=39947 RepID=UPI00291A4159|nr:hypothetical protein DAI22_04g221000 [Oryza sativa Japonica Group]
MVAPTTTTPPPPPPPPSESTPTSDPKPPPPPPTSSTAAPKKRKLEEVGFHHSPYYNIRAAVANLRGRFIQLCKGTDTQKKDAALEILKEIKVLMELSKEMRLDLPTAAGPVKLMDEPTSRDARNMPAGKIPPGEKNQVRPADQAASFMHSSGEKDNVCKDLILSVDLPLAGISLCGLEVAQDIPGTIAQLFAGSRSDIIEQRMTPQNDIYDMWTASEVLFSVCC